MLDSSTELYNSLVSILGEGRNHGGRYYSFHCPWHDETVPSFFVFFYHKQQAWFYKCHSCGKSGSLDYFLSKKGLVNHFSFYKPESVINQISEDYKGFWKDYDYAISRGISKEVCERYDFRFLFSPLALVMPIYDLGKYQGKVCRLIDNPKIRYQLDPSIQVSKTFWGWDVINKNDPVYVTEGIIDAACFITEGKQSIALLGKNYREKLDRLRTLSYPIYVPDNGDPRSFKLMLDLAIETNGTCHFIDPKYKDKSDEVTRNESLQFLFR